MPTVSNIRRLTDTGRRTVATAKDMAPNTAIELVRIFDQIDVELGLLVVGNGRPAHRRRFGWRRRSDDS